MAIQSIDQKTLDEVNENAAVRTLMARWWRELTMLRNITKDQLLVSSHCPVCFRDYPHSAQVHDLESHTMNADERGLTPFV